MRIIYLISFLAASSLLGYNSTLAQGYVLVFLNNKPDKEVLSEERTAELMKQHLANIEKLAKEGKLLVAGPFDGGGGIFIFNTNDLTLTREWLESDPAVKANRWNLEIFKVEFDKGGACLVEEPYEMVTYNFLRVNFINDIANYKMNKTADNAWRQSIRADSVLAVGRFPQYDGGFVVYKGVEKYLQDSFSNDQFVLESKTLWIARGAFCE